MKNYKIHFIFISIGILIISNSCLKSENKNFAIGSSFAIATDHVLASEIGKAIYQNGGNVFDSFVASSFAISVLRPQSTGLAGGGFALLKTAQNGKIIALDFRERAPGLSHSKMFIDSSGEVIENSSLFGAKSVAIPGNVKGLLEIHKRFGKLSRAEVLEPARLLAENGFEMYEDLNQAIEKSAKEMNPTMQKIFLKNGKPLKVGEILVQKDLANTIHAIVLNGEEEFYTGDTSKRIINSIRENQGILSENDLKNYKVIERTPIKIQYKNKEIISFPPPSSGVFILEALKIFEGVNFDELSQNQYINYYRLLIETMKIIYKDRFLYGSDPDFKKVPIEMLLSEKNISLKRNLANKNSKSQVESSGESPKTLESYNTTHISVMDSKGNLVSSTQSINYIFGSRMVASGTGLVLNDTMDDFTVAFNKGNAYGLIGGENNLIKPGKTPLSSMSPTIVQENEQVELALGAPGGSFIPNAILQTIFNSLDFKKNLLESIQNPRIHHQFQPDILYIEKELEPKLNSLAAIGYKIKISPNKSKVFAVAKTKDGKIHAVSDPRGQGLPSAY
jgi:gamma-glutamyltranspeptidase/glutathione hydrolase